VIVVGGSLVGLIAGNLFHRLGWEVAVFERTTGVLEGRTVLASGSGADFGKLVLLTPTTEVNAYGVLLDALVDTAAPYSDGSTSGSIARAGSFKGSALIVPPAVDAGLIAVALRGRGIFCEGAIIPPAAGAATED
jgi:hypothetical protein